MENQSKGKEIFSSEEYRKRFGRFKRIKSYNTTKTPKGLNHIDLILTEAKIPFEKEYKFLSDRKFKADRAIPQKRILIEYEGLFSAKSRHTTATGYTGDLEKYNLATIRGWRILRYSALNYKDFSLDLALIINDHIRRSI